MIASRAGITVPGMYRHVSSKEELLLEVARRTFESYRGVLPEVDGTGALGLAVALGTFARSRDRVARRLAVELDFGAWRSDLLAVSLKQFHREVRTSVAASLVAQNFSDGTEGADRAAMVFLMLFMGSAHIDVVDPSLVDDAAWRACLRQRVPQLIGPLPPASSTDQDDEGKNSQEGTTC